MEIVLSLFIIIVLLIIIMKYSSKREKIFQILCLIIIGGASFIILSPFVWLIAAAFKDKSILFKWTFFPPLKEWSAKTLNLNNFKVLFEPQQTLHGKVYFWEYILNSLFLSSASTMIQMFFSSLCGYALAKYNFKGKKIIFFFIIGSMMFPGMLLMSPVYKLIYNLGLMDNYLALIIPSLVTPFGIFLFRQAIMSVPDELLESARIDGCSEFGIYYHIVMPLVKPMTAAFCLISFLGNWNSFIAPQVFIQSQYKLTLPVILNQYIGIYSQQYGVFLAGTLLALLPPAFLFVALQKEFVMGLTSGALKG